MEPTAQLQAYLEGKVQGVGMRFFIQQLAKHLGLKGYVRNLPDGRVYLIAEGEKANLNKMIKEIKDSPRGKVNNVSVKWHSPESKFETFEIR